MSHACQTVSDYASPQPALQPFRTAEDAWYWTLACLANRQGGGAPPPARDFKPEHVLQCLDRLYRQRRVQIVHVRIMRLWGERARAPNPAYPRERCDWALWREALDRLDWQLRQSGIVAGPRVAAEVLVLHRS